MARSEQVPAWLTSALRKRVAGPSPTPRPEHSPPAIGDLWVVEPVHPEDSEPRICLIIAMDEANCCVSVMLTSEILDARTDRDAIIYVENLGFSLLIEADLVGPVLYCQLARRVSAVSGAILKTLLSVGREGFGALPGRGLPLRGHQDPRRAFKESEAELIERLTLPAVTFLADSRLAESVTLDPALLLPENLTAHVGACVVEALYEHAGRLPLEVFDQLISAGALDLSRWQAQHADVWKALLPFLGIREETRIGSSVVIGTADCSPERKPGIATALLLSLAQHQSDEGVCAFRMFTDPVAWTDQPFGESAYCGIEFSSGDRCQILRSDLQESIHGSNG